MEKEKQEYILIPSSPKVARGSLSFLDISKDFLLYFNGNCVILHPHKFGQTVLTIYHSSQVCMAKFSHDGRLVASIQSRGTLTITEVLPDRTIFVNKFQNLFTQAKYLDWCVDKRKVCVVGEGKTLFAKIINIDVGTNAGDLSGVMATLNTCAFRPERPYRLVLGGDESVLKVYDGPPYKFSKSEKHHSGFINQMKYNSKGTYLVTVGADKKIVLYEGNKHQKLIEKDNAHDMGIYGVDWIDEQNFVTCSPDKYLKIWNIKLQEQFIIETASGQEMKNNKLIQKFLVGVKFYDNKIYTINLTGDILIYKNPISQKKAQLLDKLSGARNKIIKILQLKQTKLILLDNDGRILNFDFENKRTTPININTEIKLILDGYIQKVEQHFRLYILIGNNSIVLAEGQEDPQTWKLIGLIQTGLYKFISKGSIASQLVGVTNNEIHICNTNDKTLLKSAKFGEDVTQLQTCSYLIAIGTLKGKLYLFNYNLEQTSFFDFSASRISCINVINSSNTANDLLVVGDSNGILRLYKIGQKIQAELHPESMGGHTSLISSVSYDDKCIYSFSMDGKIKVWNRQTIARLCDINDLVKGGILFGVSNKKYFIVSGGDWTTRIYKKDF